MIMSNEQDDEISEELGCLFLIQIWNFHKKLIFIFFLHTVSTFLPLGYLYNCMLQKALKPMVVTIIL